MFHIYDGIYRITHNPVSYNYLFKILGKIKVPWNKVSTMPLGDEVIVENFKIVRAA